MEFSLGLHWIYDCLWYDYFHNFVSTEGWVWEFFPSSNAFLNLFLGCFEVFIVEVLYFFIKFIPSYFLRPSYAKFYLSTYILETLEWNQFGHWRYIFMCSSVDLEVFYKKKIYVHKIFLFPFKNYFIHVFIVSTM